MYIVQWCDHEGNLQERRFDRLEDAQAEEAQLLETYDGVAVFSEKGSRIRLEK